MYLYLKSTDDTYAVHETLYVSKKRARTPAEWADWFERHAFHGDGSKAEGNAVTREGIIKGSVIPGINVRTQEQWDIKAYIGFTTARTRAVRRSNNPDLDGEE